MNLLLDVNMIVSTSSNEITYVWIEIDQSDGQRFEKDEGNYETSRKYLIKR